MFLNEMKEYLTKISHRDTMYHFKDINQICIFFPLDENLIPNQQAAIHDLMNEWSTKDFAMANHLAQYLTIDSFNDMSKAIYNKHQKDATEFLTYFFNDNKFEADGYFFTLVRQK